MSLREPLTPLAPDLADLLAAEKRSVELGDAQRANLLSRIASTVGGLPPVDGGEGNPPGAPPAPSGLVRALTAHPVRLALATFLAGGLLGAAIDRAATRATTSAPPPPASVAPASSPPSVATVERPTMSVTHLPDAPAPASAPPPRAPPPVAIDPITKDTALAAERTLIDTAKTALGRRDDAAALETLDRHARSYPRGVLSEEREALKVQALVGAKRVAEARVCAEHFKKTYPGSMLTAVVDDALQKP